MHLFQKNLQLLLKSNPKLQAEAEGWQLRSPKSTDPEELAKWSSSKYNSTSYPDWHIKNPAQYSEYREKLKKYHSIARTKDLWDIHEDFHMISILSDFYDEFMRLGFNPDINGSLAGPAPCTFIALGTGSGESLKKLINAFKPYRIIILVTDWYDFVSSFNEIDWSDLWETYSQGYPYAIKIARIHSANELLSVAASLGLLSLDHAYVYRDEQASEDLLKYSEILWELPFLNQIRYLGYTVDEYNMILNTVDCLKSNVRIFSPPKSPIMERAIVCGAGPSLDQSISTIYSLQNSHIIIAAGSSFATLIKNNIRVDYLTLVERDYGVYKDYKALLDEIGEDKYATKLIMSSTCSADLLKIFNDASIFYRPALTPLAAFAESNYEVLSFEGPESVNTAIGFASALRFKSILFAGVDLGAISQDYSRSKQAAGMTERRFTITERGNLSKSCYTNTAMLDCRLTIEACLGVYSYIPFFNSSDGLYIKGAEPMSITSYADSYSKQYVDHSELNRWWSTLRISSPKFAYSQWYSRDLRRNTYDLISSLRLLLESDQPWFPNILLRLDDLLEISKSNPSDQLPRRIIRSTVYKGALALSQALHKTRGRIPSEKLSQLGAAGKQILINSLNTMEQEILDLSDYVDHELLPPKQ